MFFVRNVGQPMDLMVIRLFTGSDAAFQLSSCSRTKHIAFCHAMCRSERNIATSGKWMVEYAEWFHSEAFHVMGPHISPPAGHFKRNFFRTVSLPNSIEFLQCWICSRKSWFSWVTKWIVKLNKFDFAITQDSFRTARFAQHCTLKVLHGMTVTSFWRL